MQDCKFYKENSPVKLNPQFYQHKFSYFSLSFEKQTYNLAYVFCEY